MLEDASSRAKCDDTLEFLWYDLNVAASLDLHRFVKAQNQVLAQVHLELRTGGKRTHWMWFVFPQLAGLGSSVTARRYALASLDEAAAYLAHPVLGPRLIECTALVIAIEGRSAHQIFGYPDDLKFHSSMTLFALAEPAERVFSDALRKYFGGARDRLTEDALARRRDDPAPVAQRVCS
jgi:uncharacterized protein (DUF1810 family)